MRRREFITLASGAAIAWPLAARAQQPAMPVVGFLHSASDTLPERIRGFRQGLKGTGFVEGENLAVVYRWLPVLSCSNYFNKTNELNGDGPGLPRKTQSTGFLLAWRGLLTALVAMGVQCHLKAFAVNPPSTIPPQRAESFQRHTAAHMKKQTGETLQEAAPATGMAKHSKLQFRWLDGPHAIGTAGSTQVPGFESPVAAGTKADALKHGGMGGNEVLQQVLLRAILAEQKASLLEASLKDMTAQRDKWVLQADYWKEQAQAPSLPSPARHTLLR